MSSESQSKLDISSEPQINTRVIYAEMLIAMVEGAKSFFDGCDFHLADRGYEEGIRELLDNNPDAFTPREKELVMFLSEFCKS